MYVCLVLPIFLFLLCRFGNIWICCHWLNFVVKPAHVQFSRILREKKSDHSKVVITIGNTKKVVDSRTDKYKWLNKKQVYKWNPDPSNFIKAFNSPGVKEITKQSNDYLEAGLIDSSGSLIQEIFIATAESSLALKTDYKNNRKRNNKKHPKKWSDAECYKLRKETRRYAILKHNNTTDKNLAQSHRDILKTFKKLCNSKKYSFWKEETTRLGQLLTNPEQFWKTWKGFGENKTQSNDTPDDIDGQQWEDHFRKLFVKHMKVILMT